MMLPLERKDYDIHMRNTTAICWVRNEEDIIETFVRHALAMTDHMILVLHSSNDCSQEILESLVSEGLSLDVRYNNSPIHKQSEVLTRLMHEIAHDTEWILPLDADEFPVTRRGTSFRDTVQQLPQDRVHLLPWHTYVPLPQDDHNQMNILMRMQHKRSYEQQPFSKVLIPSCLLRRAPEAVLPEGSHELLLPSHVASVTCDTLCLGHFPVRSASQLRRKIINGWESHSANPQREQGHAFHWESLYERCKSPVPLSDEELLSIALHYAVPEEICHSVPPKIIRDPVPFASKTPLKYTPALAALPV
ncbi:hypothetical protein COU78_06085 [Candidatus Peregrinibacteria bacterium CG10_big_fil_rev_8_21_14_0_10_49_24]|nr:MAG: hypothetical protein COV83_02920 [Candidatus Peregrinibacteria bacterium CG11_big_fil_rev_8_21_14_0_20_49_14]PIR50425.1 MAG: hypothetical protein COU78_06085 [Candidatus Peregrinibacteria bacterium CG10_big_fil_rev_8_21_14_0_10_49_24]PJA68261.1 MAG: hypothetical protein CO157_00075 [Candidatus Peregrinibacteria bacterium CG_4_9_14_3_um_filter_49_12]